MNGRATTLGVFKAYVVFFSMKFAFYLLSSANKLRQFIVLMLKYQNVQYQKETLQSTD